MGSQINHSITEFNTCLLILQSTTKSSSPDSLEIANVTYDDDGWYTCLAGNNIGWSQGMAYLRVVDSKFFSQMDC